MGTDGLVLDAPQPVERLPGFAQGQVSVQDAAAQLAAAWLLDGRPWTRADRVLDACAAPGGKTAHLLELSDLDLLALDSDPMRLTRVREGLQRLQLHRQPIHRLAKRRPVLLLRSLRQRPCQRPNLRLFWLRLRLRVTGQPEAIADSG